MSYIKLNGIEFDADVAISTYNRSFNVLDGDNAGRVLSGRMIRDVIGTYLGHKITVFRRGDNYEGLDTFWDYLYQHSVDDSVMLRLRTDRQPSPTRRIILAHLKTWRR